MAAAVVFRHLGSPRRRAADIAIGVTMARCGATLLSRNAGDFAEFLGRASVGFGRRNLSQRTEELSSLLVTEARAIWRRRPPFGKVSHLPRNSATNPPERRHPKGKLRHCSDTGRQLTREVLQHCCTWRQSPAEMPQLGDRSRQLTGTMRHAELTLRQLGDKRRQYTLELRQINERMVHLSRALRQNRDTWRHVEERLSQLLEKLSLDFPRFCGHRRKRDNALGGQYGTTKAEAVYGGV